MNINDATEEFLVKNSFQYKAIDIDETVDLFHQKMNLGLSRKGQELQMIPTYIGVPSELQKNESVVVIDAGGTNLRVGKLFFDRTGKLVIDSFSKYKMPGSQSSLSREEFYETFASYISPLITSDTKIGFCFSYPIESFPNKDGQILSFSKEVKVPEAVGTFVGSELKQALLNQGCQYNLDLVVLNDTVSTLLTGLASFPDRKYSGYIGFILGTGTNTCYIEDNVNIAKLPELQHGSQIINIESGNFNGFVQSEFDKMLDASSSSLGSYSFEKMTSGAYLGNLFLCMLEVANQEGLIHVVKLPETISTKDLNDYYLYPKGDNMLAEFVGNLDQNSSQNFNCLLEVILERASKMVAILLSSVVLKMNKGSNPFYPVCIAIDGSNYKGDYFLRERIEYYLYDYLRVKKGFYYDLQQVSDASLIGAGIAALS